MAVPPIRPAVDHVVVRIVRAFGSFESFGGVRIVPGSTLGRPNGAKGPNGPNDPNDPNGSMIRAVLRRSRSFLLLGALALVAASPAPIASQAVAPVTSPLQQFGANIGDDYFLATYGQLEAYWKRLDAESDRIRLVDIGRTEEGRTQWMAVISAPENLARVERYRDIAARLARAEGLTDDDARALSREGKAVVWIDGGQHASEVLGGQQLIELVYQLVSGSDDETERVLRDVIVLAAHANPDGHALVADWYMREREPRLRTVNGLPRLYQKYAGHDNNRDFFRVSQAETANINRVLYREWFPQIVYNHHQSAPAGTVMFAPPFAGPFSAFVDPLIPAGIDLLGAAMHFRFATEGKPGVTMRGGGNYSAWWNGGLRTTAYFHNQIGLITETIGSPTPVEIPFTPSRAVASPDLPYPISPQAWRFRQSIEYSMTANRAVLDAASRHRETLLFNVYRMGKNAIERGSQDSWTISSSRRAQPTPAATPRDPARRDARAYVLPADQPDFLTATRFVEALLKSGIAVHRATAPFRSGSRTYPAGSYVVKTAQAFRAHVLDMFEPQEHPEDLSEVPYDVTGWTLAFQMGVKFDRILEALDGPFERMILSAQRPRGAVAGPANPAGYLLSHHQNDAFIVVNRLLAAGETVYWPRNRTIGGFAAGTGAMYVSASAHATSILQTAAEELGVSADGVAARPSSPMLKLNRSRVGLWDRYGGATTSGWIRWVLERHEFPFERLYAQTLEAGELRRRYDVLIFPDEAVPSSSPAPPRQVPEAYRGTTGAITWQRTVPHLREFVSAGGTLILIGGATVMAESLGVPVMSALTEPGGDSPAPLSREKFSVPGSILQVAVDNTTPLGYGFEPTVDVFFEDSPVFAASRAEGVRRVAWFSSPAPLRSGWARGQRYLEGGSAVVEASIGRGRVLLFGPEIAFRAQPHGTFKFLFNGIHYALAE